MDINDRKPTTRSLAVSTNNEKFTNGLLRKILLDFTVLFCISFVVLAFYLWGQPYKRGFFCDDESLKHPYKESTVTNMMLYIAGIGLPVVAMCLTEWMRLRGYQGNRSRFLFGKSIPPWVIEIYKVVGIFLFGAACQQLTTDVAKYTIGRLRPHFFDVCKPNIDCNLTENKWRYIVDFECLNNVNAKILKEMRLSFPSGHSSFSAYSMTYFAMYLHQRFTWRGSKLVRHALQFALMLFAWYTIMTRVSDYKHHWSDVLAGLGIGTAFAIIVFTFVSDLPKTSRVLFPGREAELHITSSRQAGWQV